MEWSGFSVVGEGETMGYVIRTACHSPALNLFSVLELLNRSLKLMLWSCATAFLMG